jgi:hypothetical protein
MTPEFDPPVTIQALRALADCTMPVKGLDARAVGGGETSLDFLKQHRFQRERNGTTRHTDEEAVGW